MAVTLPARPDEDPDGIRPQVVNDPTRTRDPITGAGDGAGVWSFGHVMTVLADTPNTGIAPAAFARRWLRHWEHDQGVNFFTAEKRTQIRELLIDPWPRVPGTDDLDLAQAPFRLLAVVNRVDLRDNMLSGIPPAALVGGPGGGPGGVTFPPTVVRESRGGEARLIYGAVNPKTKEKLPFTVIFEFGVHKETCGEIKDWARQWYNLELLPLGSPSYNAALAKLTKQFIRPARDPAKPRPAFALNQVRTNEIALVLPPSGPTPPPRFWEMREFRVPHEGTEKGHLRQATVGQTPNNARPASSPEDLNEKPVVNDFINANAAELVTNTHIVPLEFPTGQPFLGARSLTLEATDLSATPPRKGFFWTGAGGGSPVNNLARHHFSLNTCNGCHGGETATPAFVMVSPTKDGAGTAPPGAELAPFLTGVTFPDPVDGTPRTFDDLGRRREDLVDLLCRPCHPIFQLPFRPVRMTH